MIRALQHRLFLLAIIGIAPMALAAIVMVSTIAREQEDDSQKVALEVARAAAASVSTELRAAGDLLFSLAPVTEHSMASLERFRARATRMASVHDWRAAMLADGQGRMLLSTARPIVNPAAAEVVDPESMRRVLAGQSMVIGEVTDAAFTRGPAFVVRVPVRLDGQLTYVISAVIPADYFTATLTRQQLADGWVIEIFDQASHQVARSRIHAKARPSPSLQALLDNGALEGAGATETLEGVPSQTAFVRLPSSAWVVAASISSREVQSHFYTALTTVAVGLLVSLGLALLLARYMARQVTGPVATLKTAIDALGRGQQVQLPNHSISGISELSSIASAVTQAAKHIDRTRQESDAQLKETTQALQLASEAERGNDDLLSALGNQLRNPMAPIATALHLMERKGDAATRGERAIVTRQVSHLSRLVDSLLDISRIKSKRLTLNFEAVHLPDMLAHAAQRAKPLLGTRQFTLTVEPAAQHLWAWADRQRLTQVLNNLLDNATRFSDPDASVALSLRQAPDGGAEIELRDSGVGMVPEVRKHVFDMFYDGPDHALGGLGLGLAIVRGVIELHRGSVRADSLGPGLGSSFVVSLPVIAAPLTAQASTSESAAAHASPATSTLNSGNRVLVVDDNKDAADTAATLLEFTGYEVRVAYDPRAALDLLSEFKPQAAMLDIELPGMNGYELAGAIRAHAVGTHCFLVALTGYGAQTDVARAFAAGFQAHLVKPASPEAMLDTLASGLRNVAAATNAST